MIAVVLFALSGVCALAAIPAPNGAPLILLAIVLYAFAWCAYKSKEIR